jgi:hypothetical protein
VNWHVVRLLRRFPFAWYAITQPCLLTSKPFSSELEN